MLQSSVELMKKILNGFDDSNFDKIDMSAQDVLDYRALSTCIVKH